MRGAANEPGKGHCRDSIFFANHVSRETEGSLELLLGDAPICAKTPMSGVPRMAAGSQKKASALADALESA
jgi:hypothetical protein